MAIVGVVALWVTSSVAAGSAPPTVNCPAGPCYELPPGSQVPSGFTTTPCPADAPPGSTCVLASSVPSGGTGGSGSPPSGGSGSPPSGGSGGQCSTSAGPLTLDNLWEKDPSTGNWVKPTGICALMQYQQQPDPFGGTMAYVVISLIVQPFNQDISSAAPAGTTFSLDLTSSGAQPLFTVGEMDNPVASFSGGKVTVQGDSVPVKFAYTQGDCSNAAVLSSFFGVAVVLQPTGSGQGVDTMQKYAGAYFGTNAQSIQPPQISADGSSVTVTISGCPQHPGTPEGFFKGFIPTNGVTQMGVSPQLQGQAPPVVDQMFNESNNGQPDNAHAQFQGAGPPQVTPSPTPSRDVGGAAPDAVTGITIDYHTPFSSHTLKTTANRANVAVAKSCMRTHGKLSVSGRGPSSRLVCSNKKAKGKPPKKRHGKH